MTNIIRKQRAGRRELARQARWKERLERRAKKKAK